MKKFYILGLLAFLLTFTASAQNIGASFSGATFYSPTDGTYYETYMSIQSSSVMWAPLDNNQKQASISLTYIFKKSGEIVKFTKEIVKSPIIQLDAVPDQFFLNVQRISLENSTYDLEIEILDLNDTSRHIKTVTKADIDIAQNGISLSDIQCLDRYSKSESKNILTKSGFDLVPYPSNVYPPEKNEFQFYVEVYNTEKMLGKDESYLITYYLKNFESGQVLPQFKRFSRRTAAVVDPFLAKFNITNLPHGNFEFVIEVRDKNNTLMTLKSYLFQRVNPNREIGMDMLSAVNISHTFAETIIDRDSLVYLILSQAPISEDNETSFAKNLIENGDVPTLQRYLYYFWSERNPTEPQLEFLKYQKEVEIANENFGTKINHGFETDQGRIFLKYGPANVRAKEYNDPGWLPYEIWHYYSTDDQRNVRFVFYATDRSINDFHLLHSTARGEVNNYRWRMELRDTPSSGNSIDDTGENDSDWGNRLNDLWNNPR
jgi:GWxTD domain-containing protein